MAEMNVQRFRRLQEQYSDPLLTVLTIMLAVLLLLVGPLQAAGVVAAPHFGIAFGLVMVAATFIVSGGVALAAILVALALIVLATVLGSRQPSAIDIYLYATAWLIAGVTLGIVVARAVFASGKVTYHRIIGAVLLYLIIGLIFVALFCFVALSLPKAFNGLKPVEDHLPVTGDLIYFSFVTLTSTGYGDIVPLHPFARGLANVEAIIGQLYPATLLARLVTLEIESRPDG
jgi:Ion channel